MKFLYSYLNKSLNKFERLFFYIWMFAEIKKKKKIFLKKYKEIDIYVMYVASTQLLLKRTHKFCASPQCIGTPLIFWFFFCNNMNFKMKNKTSDYA